MALPAKKIDVDDCDVLGHQWDIINMARTRRAVSSHQVHLRCVRCTGLRHDSYDIYGNLIARSYDYTGSTHLTGRWKRGEKPSMADMRLAMISKHRRPATKKKAGAKKSHLRSVS